jgi:hypothetical protein
MIGKIKALGLAFVAIAALGAMAASAAQAGELDIGAQPAVLTGHSDEQSPGSGKFQEHIFTLTSKAGPKLSIKCNTASFEGTTTGQKITEATVTATCGIGKGSPTEAQGCTKAGMKTQVLLNGCKYTLTGVGQAANTFAIDIVGCTVGKQIQIITSICTIDIGEQNGLSHVVAVNDSAKEITLETTLGLAGSQDRNPTNRCGLPRRRQIHRGQRRILGQHNSQGVQRPRHQTSNSPPAPIHRTPLRRTGESAIHIAATSKSQPRSS